MRNATLVEFSELKNMVINHNERMSNLPYAKPKKEVQEKVLTWFF